jgi:hypothetical protein
MGGWGQGRHGGLEKLCRGGASHGDTLCCWLLAAARQMLATRTPWQMLVQYQGIHGWLCSGKQDGGPCNSAAEGVQQQCTHVRPI